MIVKLVHILVCFDCHPFIKFAHNMKSKIYHMVFHTEQVSEKETVINFY